MTETLTAILVAITAYYAWQTRATVKAMNNTNEANNRPVISISLANDRPEGISFIDFVIQNSGNGLARDVEFTVDGDRLEVQNVGDSKKLLQDISIIKNGIKTFAPHYAKRIWLLSTINRVEDTISKNVSIKVTYRNADFSKTYNDQFELDFSSLTRMQLGHDSLHHIDKEIEKIRKVLEKKK